MINVISLSGRLVCSKLYLLAKSFIQGLRGTEPVEEYGFYLMVSFNPELPESSIDDVLDDYIELVESKGLWIGGGIDAKACNQFVFGPCCKKEDARDLVAFFVRLPETERVSVGPYVNAKRSQPYMALHWGWYR